MHRARRLEARRLAPRRAGRAGDEAAFAVLYDRHHRALLSFCRHMLGNAEDGEDALQQTFLRAHRALQRRAAPDALRPWLFAIARNRCRTMLAAARGRRVPPVEDVELSFDGLADGVARRADLRELVGRPGAAARGPARGAGAVRARRALAGRDRARDRLPGGQGQGARLPGAQRADGRARRPRDAVRVDPRGARGRARRRAAARPAAPPPAPLRAVPGLPRRGARRSARASPRSSPSPRPSASRRAVLAAAAGKGVGRRRRRCRGGGGRSGGGAAAAGASGQPRRPPAGRRWS